jgi:hypothetical protein
MIDKIRIEIAVEGEVDFVFQSFVQQKKGLSIAKDHHYVFLNSLQEENALYYWQSTAFPDAHPFFCVFFDVWKGPFL